MLSCVILGVLVVTPAAQTTGPGVEDSSGVWSHLAASFPLPVLAALVVLISLSAFFSASEVAFFSIHRVRLRAMDAEPGAAGALVVRLMQHPGRLLSTILVGNMIVNVLISVLLPRRLEQVLVHGFGVSGVVAPLLTVAVATFFLVFFGEISPKVFALRIAEPFSRAAVIPMIAIDFVLAPARWASLRFTEMIFRVTRFNDIPPAPFMTDEEIISVLAESEAHGVLEESEGQMIQAILESGDAYLRKLLVPRQEIVAIDRDATVAQALELFRRHSYSRMPVYQEDVDHMTGVLVAKDLLPHLIRGETDRSIGGLARRASFVPETMTIREFIKHSQRKHMHLSIVVDEYGGTEGLVTLDDALEEVVGEIRDAAKGPQDRFKRIARGCYLVEGGLPLDELSELIEVDLESAEHETVAGFFIDHLGKIPEVGDRVEHGRARFTVENVDGKRASTLRVEVQRSKQEQAS